MVRSFFTRSGSPVLVSLSVLFIVATPFLFCATVAGIRVTCLYTKVADVVEEIRDGHMNDALTHDIGGEKDPLTTTARMGNATRSSMEPIEEEAKTKPEQDRPRNACPALTFGAGCPSASESTFRACLSTCDELCIEEQNQQKKHVRKWLPFSSRTEERRTPDTNRFENESTVLVLSRFHEDVN